MAKPSKKKAARRNADSSRNYTFAAVFLIALVFLGLLVASGVELEQDSIAGKLHEVDRGAVSKEDNTITFVDYFNAFGYLLTALFTGVYGFCATKICLDGFGEQVPVSSGFEREARGL